MSYDNLFEGSSLFNHLSPDLLNFFGQSLSLTFIINFYNQSFELIFTINFLNNLY